MSVGFDTSSNNHDWDFEKPGFRMRKTRNNGYHPQKQSAKKVSSPQVDLPFQAQVIIEGLDGVERLYQIVQENDSELIVKLPYNSKQWRFSIGGETGELVLRNPTEPLTRFRHFIEQ